MHSFLSSSTLSVLNVGITVDNYPSLTYYFSYPVVLLSHIQPHKQYHCGLSGLNHFATASMFHTQKARHLNSHLTYSTERYSVAAFVRASAVIILEPSLSALRSHSSLIIINQGSDGGLQATWLMPHIDLMQTLRL